MAIGKLPKPTRALLSMLRKMKLIHPGIPLLADAISAGYEGYTKPGTYGKVTI